MYAKEAPTSIQAMFNRIAERYDLTNAVLSFSMHHYWNHSLVKHVCHQRPPAVLLDLCSGTGDIALQYLRNASIPCHAHCIDFSSEMLELARKKGRKYIGHSLHQLTFIESDVQNLPLPNAFADCATMAYGMRNVQNPKKSVEETFRVLKPGGCFGILELTRPKNKFLSLGHKLYLRTFIPLLGKWLTSSPQAYQYLCQSIQSFLAPEEVQEILRNCGFIKTQCVPLSGGIATLILGFKP